MRGAIRNHYSTEWFDFVEGCKPAWDFPSCDYRAKPEPLVIYAEIVADGKVIQYGTTEFKATNGGTVKKFVEVTE